MSSHFLWYPSTEEVKVPWNASYSFPSQANKAIKITPRIPPKNGGQFSPGDVIRLEFPAQGYVNPGNTFLSFDVLLYEGLPNNLYNYDVCFQNNIQSIFNRVRLLYGASPLEDLNNYNVIVRNLTEWTATAGNTVDQTSIMEGIGGTTFGGSGAVTFGLFQKKTRSACIQSVDTAAGDNGFVPGIAGTENGARYTTRRYQIQFALGLFTQGKLIPTKFMASQLAIELTLSSEAQCLFSSMPQSNFAGGAIPTYKLKNVNLIPEILEFDASYDANFIRGLQNGGVPIKFSSYHTFQFPISSTVNALIQERSRSVKALFAVVRRSPALLNGDSCATLMTANHSSTLQNYQYRIGGRYFPASPVQVSTAYGSLFSNGGAEAYAELAKCLNIVGDYRLSSAINTNRWAYPNLQDADLTTPSGAELDYANNLRYFDTAGNMVVDTFGTGPLSGNIGSNCFTMAVSLETSNGMEISGLNAEEQSDISFQANWSPSCWNTTTPGNSPYLLEVYSYYDAMIVLRENNVVELIQ